MDVKQLMQEKGEWIAMGAAGAILLVYIVLAYGVGGDNEQAQMDQLVSQATNALNREDAPTLKKSDFSGMEKPWKKDAVAAPAGKGEYVAMFKPTVTARVKKGDKPAVEVEKPGILLDPVNITCETELGQVTVKWQEGKKPGVKAAVVNEYQVFRQEAGKDWVLLEKLPGMRKSTIDKSVEPKKKYAYKVKATTKEKTENNKSESGFTATAEATIPSGVAIVYKGGSPQLAQIKVRKFLSGEWKERAFYVAPKNEEKEQTGLIGKLERERNAESNKMEEVDYRTGFVLLEIRKDRYKYKKVDRVPKIDPKGGSEVEYEEIEKEMERDRYKIIYTDDEGKQKEMWIADEGEEEGDK